MNQEIEKSKVMIEYEEKSPGVLRDAENILILNNRDLPAATEILVIIKKHRAIIKKEREDVQGVAYRSYQKVKGLFDKLENPLIQAENIVKQKQGDFMLAEENRIKKEQEEIDRKARIEEERKRKELEERAKKWAEKGNQEKADQLLEQSQNVFVPAAIITPIEKSTQIEGGMSTAKDDIEVVSIDREIIIKAMVTGDLPNTLVDVNAGAVKRYMKSMFGNMDKSWNGITVKKIKIIATRREK